MPTFGEIKIRADQLRKEKKHSEALPFYKDLWGNHRDNCNEWDGWGFAFCLKQNKEYSTSLDVCREVYRLKPDFEHIKGLYAWCIYFTEISIETIQNEANFFRAGEGIIKLTKQEDKSIQQEKDFPCVYTLSVFKILGYLKNKATYNPEKIIYWTDKLNPNFLQSKPTLYKDNDGVEKELAPQKEDWFSLRTKALLENSQYEECILSSTQALETLTKFHYDNDIWLKRNIALARAKLGEKDLALSDLKDLLKRKNEWFIQKEIADIYMQQGKLDEAINYAIDGALNFGDADKKLNLYRLLADLLKSKGKMTEAKAHVELIFQIRNASQWKIDLELSDLIKEFAIDTNRTVDIRDLLRQIKLIWEQLKFGNQELLKGTIKSLISEGKAGFIDAENRNSYFFSSKMFKGGRHLMQIGQKVSFFLEDSFDKKKNQPTKIAVNIKPLK